MIPNDEKEQEELKTTNNISYYDWTPEMQDQIESILNSDPSKQTDFWYKKYEKDAKRNWDIFYKHNTTNFFKNRYYIDSEFTELKDLETKYKNCKKVYCELGCGVGNTIFPLSQKYKNLIIYGFDFSVKAIELVKKSQDYDPKTMIVDVCDLVNDPIPLNFESPDYCSLIFVLSAISPENHQIVIKKIYEYMKPGSILFFRDYGKYDLAQTKLAKQKCAKLKENFYVKSDGTRVYYFKKNELSKMFLDEGFNELYNENHYRLVENKKDEIKMHRVWIQAKFMK